MIRPTRRQLLAGAGALPLGAAASAAPAGAGQIAADLDRYIGFGSKQAGGSGDHACGSWLADELARSGYAIERQEVAVPFFVPGRCELAIAGTRASVWPQPIVVPTGPDGRSGHLVRVDADGRASAPLAGAVALVDLPFGRWSSALARAIRLPIDTAFADGAVAAVAITNGPTGKVIALNADGRKPMFAGPVALLAPDDADPFLAAARRGDRATLRLEGRGGQRPAFNFVGRRDRGRRRWLVVSTPRSGWFGCAGERGGGIAAWLHLARWAAAALPDHDLAFLCNSGHEYEYLGAEHALGVLAPPPAVTDFWLHLGANLAARDWHDALGGGLAPLPGTDSQRYLAASATLLPLVRTLFAGLPGLEAPYDSAKVSAGELTGIVAAGYRPAAGVFGLHRFHHVADDDARCVSPAAVAETTAAFRRLIEGALRVS
jgi:hypothetical protein